MTRKEFNRTVRAVYNGLASESPTQKTAAIERVAELGEDAGPVLAAVFARGRRIRRWLGGLMIVVMSQAIIYTLARYFLGYRVPWDRWLMMVFYAFQLFAFPLLLTAERSRLHRSLVDAIARIEDTRLIGPIAELLRHGEFEDACRDALRRLAPMMRRSDFNALSPRQRDCLYHALGDQGNFTQLAIMEGLELAADESAVPVLARLAAGEISPLSSMNVRAAAKRTLEAILQRAREEKQAETLLRASATPPDSDASLLRPTMEQELADSALLRPADSA